MKEIDCRKCKNCDTLKGCMKYGSNPWIAVKRCAADCFKNYSTRGKKMKKYEFTGETKNIYGHILHRIRALIDFGNVKAGDLGGWIKSEKNLSQEENCWVYGDARVSGDAQVYGNAWVCGNAEVYDDARVYGNARVYGDAQIYGDAWVYGNAPSSYPMGG